MSDPPPPSSPPPGWYPDPAETDRFRWWDGQGWTETITDDVSAYAPAPSVDRGSVMGPVGAWISESFRLLVQRSGHVLPMVLIFVLTLSVPSSFALWYGLRDTVVTFDPNGGAPEAVYGGSQAALIIAAVLFPVSTLLSYLLKGSAIRHAWAIQAGTPEPWSESVMDCLRRSGRIIPVSAARTLLYWGLSGLFFVGLLASPAVILLFPVLLVLLIAIWVFFSFANTVATLGGPDDRPFATSRRLSAPVFFPLFGRLLLLGFLSVNLVLVFGFIGTPFTALAGGTGEAVAPSTETLRFNELLGVNAAVFALGSLFSAIGLGANYVLSAVGTTLLYRKLDGPVADPPDSHPLEGP